MRQETFRSVPQRMRPSRHPLHTVRRATGERGTLPPPHLVGHPLSPWIQRTTCRSVVEAPRRRTLSVLELWDMSPRVQLAPAAHQLVCNTVRQGSRAAKQQGVPSGHDASFACPSPNGANEPTQNGILARPIEYLIGPRFPSDSSEGYYQIIKLGCSSMPSRRPSFGAGLPLFPFPFVRGKRHSHTAWSLGETTTPRAACGLPTVSRLATAVHLTSPDARSAWSGAVETQTRRECRDC